MTPILIIGYKKKTLIKSSIKNFVLALLLVTLGVVIVMLFFGGVGLIWLLLVISLLLAIQYQHIFLDNPVSL